MGILNCQEYFLLNIVLLIPIIFLHHYSSYPSCYVVHSLAMKRLWFYPGCWSFRIAATMWNTLTEITSHLCAKYL